MKTVNKNEFKELLSNKKIVLVDFFATWCGPCKMLAPVLEELHDDFKDDELVVITKVDVDEEQELLNKYRITSVPTLLLFKEGELVDKAIGYRSKNQLADMINAQK